MLEKDVVLKCREWLNKEPGTKVWKMHGSPFMPAGMSDLIGIYHGGRFIAVEVKLPGKEKTLTPLQAKFIELVRSLGAIGLVVTSLPELQEKLEKVDMLI